MSLMVPEESSLDMFELAPVSLWLEDYSAMKALFDLWRAEGVEDLEVHLLQRPERVAEAAAQIRLLRVNRRTLEMLGASTQQELEDNMETVLSGDMYVAHVRELVALWNGETEVTTHTVNYRLTGERLDVVLHLTVLPGHEEDWSRVMVSIEDVSERVQAGRLLAQSEVHAVDLTAAALDACAHAAHKLHHARPLTIEVRDLVKRPLEPAELVRFEAVVFDPPRAGAERQAQALASAKVPCVVAVSCNIDSFCRDAAILVAGGYRLERVDPIDQFRHSPHVEIVAVFRHAAKAAKPKRRLLG